MVIVDYSQHSQTNQLGGANIDMLIIWIILNPMLWLLFQQVKAL
jgi:hypothetical protein